MDTSGTAPTSMLSASKPEGRHLRSRCHDQGGCLVVIQTNVHMGKGFTWGDSPTIRRNVVCPPGITVAGAYLTVKTNQTDVDPGLFQKHITASNVAGTGQVEDT